MGFRVPETLGPNKASKAKLISEASNLPTCGASEAPGPAGHCGLTAVYSASLRIP